jgi:hypothetical protein
MAESTQEVEKRTAKRSKMRQRLDSAFGDPLQDFKTPVAVRQISNNIENECAELEGRIRKISDSSNEPIGDEPDRTSLYIDQRQELVEDIEAHLKEARKMVRQAREHSSNSQRNELKMALMELDETDKHLLKERAALASDRIRVQYGMLGQLSHVKIGEAYMMAITENAPEPAEASYKRQHKRSGADQTSFRNRLMKAYHPEGSKVIEKRPEFQTSKIWCPVSGKEFEASTMKAAHIVPYSIGEANATYLFGSKPDEGYGVIWSERNGLMLHTVLEKIFDDGRMVIVPDPTDDNEFISIILSQDLLSDSGLCPAVDAPYSTIHKKRLQFQTAARPGKRYLYVHALLSIFRRRRYDVPGWETDRQQVFKGQIWATPGKWARKSMVEALAFEIGDTWDTIEVAGGLGDFSDRKLPKEEKAMATVMRYLLETRTSNSECEDDE